MVTTDSVSQKLTLAEFLELPETKPASEYIDGEVYQKPMPQGKHSILQTRLTKAINAVSEPQQLALALTELRCTFSERSIVPDIAVFEWSRIPVTNKGRIKNRIEIAPDWMIEILSPEQSVNKVMKNILFCLHQGAQLGWLIDPEDESVLILKSGQMPEIKSEAEQLPVLDCLQDWEITAKEVFDWLNVMGS
ncbi:MAG: Uma2 family endonuclease [Halothece sp. Uz-M2-17]|nr:Uma2 family endonuclease [Halothece sp. Uz-M2-17]